MNTTSLIQSLQSLKLRTFLVVLFWVALVAWPTLTPPAVAGYELIQERQDNPQSNLTLRFDRTPQSQTAFAYQGQLKEGDLAANGSFDFQFTLYTTQTRGEELGSFLHENILLTNGLFKVSLDFGRAVTNGQEMWLEIAVRPSGSGDTYTVLSPRQRLTPTPYAILAQHEQWSLIGVPVGFPGAGAKDAVLTDEVAALATANYIPKYTGPDLIISTLKIPQLADSVMVESSGKIGVGTTMPAEKLDVAGTVKATAFLGDGSALTGISDDTKVTKAGDTMTGTLNLPTNGLVAGTSQLVLAGGNVGIGTTNPQAKFELRVGGLGPSLPLFAVRRNFPMVTLTDFIINSDGNVGIGTATPKTKLDVVGGAVVTVEGATVGATLVPIAIRGLATSGIGVFGSSSGTGIWGESTSGTGVVARSTSGDIIRGNGGGTLRFRVENDGDVFATAYKTLSDARLKSDVERLTGALEKLQQIRGVSYARRDIQSPIGSTGQRDIGVIAQEVETVFPELVSIANEAGHKAVAYERLTAVLIEAVKELKADNEALRAALKSLEQMVKGLKENERRARGEDRTASAISASRR